MLNCSIHTPVMCSKTDGVSMLDSFPADSEQYACIGPKMGPVPFLANPFLSFIRAHIKSYPRDNSKIVAQIQTGVDTYLTPK